MNYYIENSKKLYKYNTKDIKNKIKKLNERLQNERYYYLSKLLNDKGLKEFLFEFMKLYDSMRKIDSDDFYFLYYNKQYYKFIYNYQIVQQLKKDKSTVSKKTNILVALGLINKLNVYDQKISKLTVVKKALNKSKKEGNRPVNFYSIPNYTHKLLKEANYIASILLNNHITLKKFNKTFLIKALGQEFANKVFLDKRVISHIHIEEIQTIKNILITELKNNSIISLYDFKELIYEFYKNNSDTYKKDIISNNIDYALTELIGNNVIVRRRLKKDEKTLYNKNIKDYSYYILKGEFFNEQ